jgi:hypothetical protein
MAGLPRWLVAGPAGWLLAWLVEWLSARPVGWLV